MDSRSSYYLSLLHLCRRHLDFFRIHLTIFTLVPALCAGIVYASSHSKIGYVDSLFVCMSAMSQAGLSTVDLSLLTPWQQVLLYLQMFLGGTVTIAWIMVYIRKSYFDRQLRSLTREGSPTTGLIARIFSGVKKRTTMSMRYFNSEKTPSRTGDSSGSLSLGDYVRPPLGDHLPHDSGSLDRLGGIEYRALKLLLWVVGLYHISMSTVLLAVTAPYMSRSTWKSDFLPPQLHRSVSPIWFSLFQIQSAYSNNGLSLVDQSMIPFKKAYPLIFVMCFLTLAGNTAFPLLLRLVIWSFGKVLPVSSPLKRTVKYLLRRPRRCFLYLFPSKQTWLLVFIIVIFTCIDWIFFVVLKSEPDISRQPVSERILLGVSQGVFIRTAGFMIVPLANVSPALKVLYVAMMYISAYPVAISVRATNVYEERSLGIFKASSDTLDSIDIPDTMNGSGATNWGRYVAWHARQQLAYDMWWLTLALFLICIIENDNLLNPELATWFDVFTILFEIVSAYGCVGLSAGVPNANYSFSGALRPLSKLVICAVMLRGRHRGLPAAIDRAVLLQPDAQEPDDCVEVRENTLHRE